MSFASDIGRLGDDGMRKARHVFVASASTMLESIKVGSLLTGAPGQPVDTGALRNSWLMEDDGQNTKTISSPMEYAPAVEDGVGPYGSVKYGAKNGIGGSHSVNMTEAGAQKIVDFHVAQIAGGLGVDDLGAAGEGP